MSDTTKSNRVQVNLTPAELDQLRKIADRRLRSVAYIGREYILAGLKKDNGKVSR